MPGERIPPRLRAAVTARAAGCCEYCRSQASFCPDPLAVEHILPRARGGRTVLRNLALCCQGCNNHKYVFTEATDPLTDAPAPLFHPRRDAWDDHFAWADDYTRIVGLTPIGRATVALLRLNRPGLINLRRVLYAAGEHPPEVAQGIE
jgi:hypothetical protein